MKSIQPEDRTKPLLLGHVGRARGLRGEVHVRLLNPDSALLQEGQALAVQLPDQPAETCVVRRAQRQPKGWVVQLEGVHDRDAAERLRGAALSVPWDTLPALDGDEFYYEELRGFEVVDGAGRHVGVVAGLFETNVDMLVVRDGADELLIPVLDGFVTNIDRSSRRIEIDPPAGLLDVNRSDDSH